MTTPWVIGLLSKDIDEWIRQDNLFGLPPKYLWEATVYRAPTNEDLMLAFEALQETLRLQTGSQPPAMPMSPWEHSLISGLRQK